jgi:transcriptional regulator GlxA family with amidase domain
MTIIGSGEQAELYQPSNCRESQTIHDQITAVSRSVRRMHENLGEAHPLPSLARSALLSPFHFHRVFFRPGNELQSLSDRAGRSYRHR